MAYPTGAEIVAGLRLDPSAFDVAEVDKLAADAIDHLREASGTPAGEPPPETATAREFVAEYASGHALKRVVQIDEAEKLLVRADKLLTRYDASHTSPTEQTNESQVAIIFRTPW